MKEIKAWACDYCSFQNYYMSVVIDHEISCDFNPKNRTCETCDHLKNVHCDSVEEDIKEAMKIIPDWINYLDMDDFFDVTYCRQMEVPVFDELRSNVAMKIKRNCMYWRPNE